MLLPLYVVTIPKMSFPIQNKPFVWYTSRIIIEHKINFYLFHCPKRSLYIPHGLTFITEFLAAGMSVEGCDLTVTPTFPSN